MSGLTVDMKQASTTVAQSLMAHSSKLKSALTSAASTTTASSTSTGTDITSNDFLSLLVTEMKNQDPTQPTDPNAYIQQLVGVNSLQQLISINNELGTTTSTASTAASSVPSASAV